MSGYLVNSCDTPTGFPPEFNGRNEFFEEPRFDYGGVPLAVKAFGQRRGPSFSMLCACVFLPWLLFTFPFGTAVLVTFSDPLAVTCCNLAVLFVLANVGYSSLQAWRDPYAGDRATWMTILFALCLTAGVAGIVLGEGPIT